MMETIAYVTEKARATVIHVNVTRAPQDITVKTVMVVRDYATDSTHK